LEGVAGVSGAEEGMIPARRRWGQNFLVHPETARRIVLAAELSAEESVIEVGPGDGALTGLLLEAARRVLAIEIDPARAAALARRLGKAPEDRLRIRQGDALQKRYAEHLAEEGWEPPAVLVANLPYNVATPLLTQAVEEPGAISRIVATVQREVADRLTARAGDAAYGFLSIRTAAFARARRLFDIPPGAFRPTPKVVSSVVAIRPDSSPPSPHRARALALASRAFHARRKVLPNALAGEGTRETWVRALGEIGKDARARAEELSYEDWLALAAIEGRA
jgi:16S rRNA (adenine1518-N6/adenine1519-N6)-dimethyltransferase